MQDVEVHGVRLSAIGLGTWQFGSGEWGYGDDYAANESARIVHRALELGVDLVDTAEIYGRGKSESAVGRAIAGRRDRVFVATKRFPLTPIPRQVVRHARASAGRLGVDVIDLYQIHWPMPLVPIRRQMRAMKELLDAGVVAHVGVSNFGLGRWKKAEHALGAPVLSNQLQYSLAAREPDAEMIPYAQRHDRLVIAYSPLAKGLLSGRYDATNMPTNAIRRNDPLILPENLARARDLIETLRRVAESHDATPSQVALAWVISHRNVVVIPGASSVAQLEANAAAADLDLTAADLAELTSVSDAFEPAAGVGAYANVARRRIRH